MHSDRPVHTVRHRRYGQLEGATLDEYPSSPAARTQRKDVVPARTRPRNELKFPCEDLNPRGRSERWAAEAQFFDAIAERLQKDVRAFDESFDRRYLGQDLNPAYSKQFRLQLLGDLSGQRVLDVGCGEGSNAVLLARRGADVTGVDISPRCVELADARARANNVAERTRFYCSPLELADLPERAFDVIWVDGVLHHVIPELGLILGRIQTWAKPGARFVFSEPLCLHPVIRRLRSQIPIHTDATPDERPLQRAELDLIHARLPDLNIRRFELLSRGTRFVLGGANYETAHRARQKLCDALHAVDHALLHLPALSELAGMAVLYGTFPR